MFPPAASNTSSVTSSEVGSFHRCARRRADLDERLASARGPDRIVVPRRDRLARETHVVPLLNEAERRPGERLGQALLRHRASSRLVPRVVGDDLLVVDDRVPDDGVVVDVVDGVDPEVDPVALQDGLVSVGCEAGVERLVAMIFTFAANSCLRRPRAHHLGVWTVVWYASTISFTPSPPVGRAPSARTPDSVDVARQTARPTSRSAPSARTALFCSAIALAGRKSLWGTCPSPRSSQESRALGC